MNVPWREVEPNENINIFNLDREIINEMKKIIYT
jgi:hypothetical protein